MVGSLDENFGRILEAIDRHGMRQRTLVLILSDNGGYDRFGISDNTPLRGGKNTLWEGGVRVLAAVRWPAAWQGGRKITEPLAYIDVLPMLARIAGVESLPDDLDGKDICDVLGGERTSLQREVYLGPQTLVTARWKLVAGQLFDVAADPGEIKDVAQDHPEVVQRLQRKLAGLQ